MDVIEKRKRNFCALCDKHSRGTIAQKMGYSDTNYVNQLYKGHGSFGGKTARKVESALNLPLGWMDELHADAPDESDEHRARRESLRRLLELVPEENIDAAETVLRALTAAPGKQANQ
ncbi:MAG: hypothetical protein CMN85_10480 [Spongiibacteraceae bacterium]|nr:hypothetical protein [Spongiibacteraceae bacterium]|tara:strand:- start:1411 stop:1764 length:354 start_codon:yes stop_codon:yes gene_type:complete